MGVEASVSVCVCPASMLVSVVCLSVWASARDSFPPLGSSSLRPSFLPWCHRQFLPPLHFWGPQRNRGEEGTREAGSNNAIRAFLLLLLPHACVTDKRDSSNERLGCKWEMSLLESETEALTLIEAVPRRREGRGLCCTALTLCVPLLGF